MPRKTFVADVQAAKVSFKKANTSDLGSGDEDGLIKFNYHLHNGDSTEISILVPGWHALQI